MNIADMYIHMDEGSLWRWYFYTPSGVCFMSRQAFASAQDAWAAMQHCQDMM